MIRIVRAAGIALAGALACSGSQRQEPTRPKVATVSVPEPKNAEPPDASSEPAEPDAEAPEQAEPEANDAGAGFGVMGLADGGIGFGQIGGSGFGSGRGRLGGTHKGSQVSIGAPVAAGGLDKDVIRRVVRQHSVRIRYCYEKELVKDPNLATRASPRFTIAPDGKVVAASLAQSSGVPSLDTCILTVIRSMQFPAFDGGVVVVTYPFVFKSAP